jgi:hypothetical protein
MQLRTPAAPTTSFAGSVGAGTTLAASKLLVSSISVDGAQSGKGFT